MNLSLQDPFAVAKEYPETLIQTFHHGHAVVIQFNVKGDYLAAGFSDGRIFIYDLVSYTINAVLRKNGHVRQITSLNWSHCGRYLLSSSQDWCCILWDLKYANKAGVDKNPAVIRKIRFDSPVWSASLHPRNPYILTASLFEDDPVHVDLTDADDFKVTKLKTEPLEQQEKEQNDAEPKKKETKHMTLVTRFSPLGDFVMTGTSKGWLNILNADKLETVYSTKVTNSNIKTLEISRNGRKLAVNSSDRVIRQFTLPDMLNNKDPSTWEFEIEHKYQDVVNRLQWNTVAFNHNSEFLVASTFGQSSQDLYLWETQMGSLVKILEGSHEELIDVKWNYNKCMIGSTGLDTGAIYLWSVQFPSKWSALAPDFVEIEENDEYEEKEDEFDIIDETEVIKKRLEEEDTEVDIITRETTDARGFDTGIESFVIPIDYEKPVF
ncbi:chromatin binding protein [Candidozyma auris]|uniref:Uncharacterized protein n=2 Tax=Candidozyma auris TaxID=498019 RepID=A0AB36W308_CANAR|nr:hypothetical protein QG37_02287 [[Candida] auris]PIS51284.1 hypothetical protein B9J08_002859 [[Candida] auris]PIS53253.1 hypothetical protein CJI97_002915 [[Candida] auris]QWW22307.1 hypothetical protein CA7LBN_001053 [[Candida] auris]